MEGSWVPFYELCYQFLCGYIHASSWAGKGENINQTAGSESVPFVNQALHQLSTYSLSGLLKKKNYFAKAHTKNFSPLFLMLWHSLQPPAVNCVWCGFDPQCISYLASVALHFLLNGKSIITIPGRIFFYTYAKSMLLTRDFCPHVLWKTVKKGTVLAAWRKFSRCFQALQEYAALEG